MKALVVLFLGICALVFVARGADAHLMADGAKVEVLGEGYSFTEGPAADREGNVFFTDQPNDRIVKYNAADGSFCDWLKPAGRGWVIYLMPGHRWSDFENGAYGRIVLNAIIFKP